ncbi:MAG: BlaI/MecI/CopY family transcriptional regulator [Acidobacteria bacterium]|nr:BlaI/MecI/CopY family transcriptional regulator [Acidobacteriota bacterium]
MAASAQPLKGHAPRKSILDLAPLELDCMNTLWPLGEGTVRQIQQALAASRPRAYTTIMTIMDRLAHKGVVARHKVGRAYVYRANLSAEEARAHAVEQVVDGFFEGSAEALAAHLGPSGGRPEMPPSRAERRPRAELPRPALRLPAESEETPAEAPQVLTTPRLDESLL